MVPLNHQEAQGRRWLQTEKRCAWWLKQFKVVATAPSEVVKMMSSDTLVMLHPRDLRKYLIRESTLHEAGGPTLAGNGYYTRELQEL